MLLCLIAFHFPIFIPGACHQNDRDRTREFLMSWIKITSRKQPWFHKVSLDVYDGGLYIISDLPSNQFQLYLDTKNKTEKMKEVN